MDKCWYIMTFEVHDEIMHFTLKCCIPVSFDFDLNIVDGKKKKL